MSAWQKQHKTVRVERTGFRDEWISERHRQWGFNCPAKDIDFLLAEYDRGEPRALIEYKHKNASAASINSNEHSPIRWMADKCGIPFAVVVYDDEAVLFRCIPKNTHAIGIFKSSVWLSETDYVAKLYELRGRDLFTDADFDWRRLRPANNNGWRRKVA